MVSLDPALDPGLAESDAAKQLQQVGVGIFLQVQAGGFTVEVAREMSLGAVQPIGRDAVIAAARLEYPIDLLQLLDYILRVDVLDYLVAERQVDCGIGAAARRSFC